MRRPSNFVSVCFLFLLSGCAATSAERSFRAETVASSGNLQKTTVRTDPFILTAYSRIQNPGQPLHVYIEGDGYAWVTPTRVSGDPTPREPLALSLAAEDPAPNVVYLARPCQYTPVEMNSACEDEAYWTNKRFSEEVVRSVGQAIDKFLKDAQSPEIHLIGYSGGGAVAVLIAARRKDVKSLRTVAGNLDPTLVNDYHGVSRFEGSLDPMDVAGEIAAVPQLHFIGGEDTIIPLAAVGSFLKKMGDGRCFQTKTLPDASHKDGWIESWRKLLDLPVICKEGGDRH